MSTLVIIIIIGLWFAASIVTFVVSGVEKESYADLDTGIIYVSRNAFLSWGITHFLPQCAIPYDILCEKITGQGLLIVLIGIYLLTLPMSLLTSTIGIITMILITLWKRFLKYFKKEETYD